MKRPSKYRAIKTELDGHLFDSKAESQRYAELRILEKIGEIQNLELQPVFPIVINGVKICKYIGDFAYFEKGKRVIEDVKGMRTPVYRLKKKLVEAIFVGTKIIEVTS